jgi:hexosaminidase
MLRRAPFSLVLSAILGSAGCGSEPTVPGLIPLPESVSIRSGEYRLTPESSILVSDPGDGELVRLAEYLAEPIRVAGGFPLPVSGPTDGSDGAIRLSLDSTSPAAAGLPDTPLARPESYEISSGPAGIEIRAASHAGLFYGIQSLRQLLPPGATTGARSAAEGGWTVPALEIRDGPRFVYRGLHLDVGRHYFTPEFIKRYIDLLASYKLNVFHWHLTEDQGWRLQIDRYPRLAEVSSQRRETILEKNFDPYVGDGIPHGGYYTKDDVRDIVAYAAERYVTVIPEIELPGHSVAALAAYPELACTDGPFEVATVWGVKEDIYCPHERTFEFLEGVLTEVMELFPSPYIHIGGDEAPKARWEESEVAQEVMRREGLADEHELQSWFIRRIERFLLDHDRRLIGWDEILEGGLAPQATVMSWRGVNGGIEAARQGHDVIMTPTSHMYFDYYQGADQSAEPLAIGGYLPLEKVYAFEPVPAELTGSESRHILGVQANVWTEYIQTPEHAEYMAYPRALALAEVAWSPALTRDWSGFMARLPAQLSRLEALGVNFRIPQPAGLEEDRLTLSDRLIVELGNPLPAGEVRYTLDGSDPEPESPLYRKPLNLKLDEGGTTVSARVYLPGGKGGPIARARLARTSLRPAQDVGGLQLRPGLEFAYAEGPFESAREVSDAPAIRRGRTPRVQLTGEERPEDFGLRLDGYLQVPDDELYTFELTSDDGSQLYVKNILIIDHDGWHGATGKIGAVALASGHHRLSVLFFQSGGGRDLALRVRRGDGPFEAVPDEWFSAAQTEEF